MRKIQKNGKDGEMEKAEEKSKIENFCGGNLARLCDFFNFIF